MPQITGTFFGTVTMQTAVGIPDTPNHALVIASVTGKLRSADNAWNGAKLTYWGMGDLLSNAGKQSGYFLSEHQNGKAFGNFEGDVTMSDFESRIEGTWNFKSGSGTFSGIAGGGKFSGLINPTCTEIQWSGEYTQRDSGRACSRTREGD